MNFTNCATNIFFPTQDPIQDFMLYSAVMIQTTLVWDSSSAFPGLSWSWYFWRVLDSYFAKCFLSIFSDDHMFSLLWTFHMMNSANGFYNVIFCIPRLYPTADECIILLIFAELICLYFNISHLHLWEKLVFVFFVKF